MTTPTPLPPSHLPATIRAYLAAHAAGEANAAIRAFAPTAEVVDDGRTYRGAGEVLDFLRHAGAEFTYTTEVLGAERVDDENWIAVIRLEGDFPGGVAVLRYRFAVADDLIASLVIAP